MSSGSARPIAVPVAAACFFASGMAGLLYEVVWMRLLGLVFGHTVHAVTLVLATYMGGLALGSVLLGRWADRVVRPLRVYGLLELGVGAYCLLTPWLFGLVEAAYLGLSRSLPPSGALTAVVHLGLAALVLLPPTTLMGATLPVLSRAVVRAPGLAAAQVGTLYALNTWGAVVGTATTGMALLPTLGLRHTVWLGVALNGLVGGLALLLEKRLGGAADTAAPPSELSEGPRADDPGAPGRLAARVGLFAIGVSGAAAMAYEIAWTRALSLVLGSSTYAFTAMLTTFLVGLALGSLVVARALRRRRFGLVAFGLVQAAVGPVVVLLLPAFGVLPEATLAVLRHTGVTHLAALGTQFGFSFLLMILPTLLIGATFPLLVAALSGPVAQLGRDVGRVYGANTVGTIAGSVLAGFVLLPALGMERTVMLAASASVAAGLAVVWVAGRSTPRARWAAVAVAAAVVVAAVALPRWDPKKMTSGAGVYASQLLDAGALGKMQEGRELLFYAEGINTTVSVERTENVVGLRVNGKADATNGGDMPTQVLVGHLGALLAPKAERVLIIGLASGVTVGAVAQHPVSSIEVAELEPAMVQASAFFRRDNRDALADPRVHLIEGDGRHVLAAAPRPYDLVISEPSNPWIAGIASLFTREFYQAARQQLSPQGVMVQWLQGYSIYPDDMQMVVRTFQEVFPHVSIWVASPNDYLLVATPKPVELDLELVRQRLAASPGLADDFSRFGWNDEGLVFRFFMGEEDVRRLGAGARVNTDDLPLLEFSAPRALYQTSGAGNKTFLRSFRTVDRPPVRGLDSARYEGPAGRLRAARAQWWSENVEEAEYELARVGPVEALSSDERLDRARLLFVLGRFEEAGAELSALALLRPGDPMVTRYQAGIRALLESQRRPAARPMDVVSAGRFPGRENVAELLLEAAQQQEGTDLYQLAREQLEAAVAADPGSYVTLNNLAGVRYHLGDLPGALAALERSRDIHPGIAQTQLNLGLVLRQLGRPDEARRAFTEAARLEPTWPAPRRHLESMAAPSP